MERARKEDLLQKLKRDHEFSKEVVAVLKSTAGRDSSRRLSPLPPMSTTSQVAPLWAETDASLFIPDFYLIYFIHRVGQVMHF